MSTLDPAPIVDPADVPPDLIALEIEHRTETARVNERRKSEPGTCGYRAYLLGKRVANHPWLTAYPAGPQRRAARKALRAAARENAGAGTGQAAR